MVGKATQLDAGAYTCRVVDWGVQQCKSVHISIREEPSVKVVPMSVTVDKVSVTFFGWYDREHDILV